MFKEYILSVPQDLYIRIYGAGPPIVLFHPSPNSSKMMHDLANILSSDFTVICPDTPGYGLSQKLGISEPSMTDYVLCFQRAFQELGLNQLAIYGSATGGQLAIRYGLEYPDEVQHLFLDNCAHFTDEERADILQSYFPDLTPQHSGDHLIQLWDMVSHLFKYFPWCFKDENHKLSTPAPPIAVLHNIALEYLQAGKDYDLAYKAAFNHEKVSYIQDLTVSTFILRWQGSILKTYTDRIFEFELNPNVKQSFISADRNLRYPEMASFIKTQYGQHENESQLNPELIAYKASDDTADAFEGIGVPPKPTATGEYLVEAWKQLLDTTDKNKLNVSLNQINKHLALWYLNN